jgi:sugar lactone lactonase YvrE
LIARNLGFLNGMDWGRDGRLYAPVWTQGRVVSIDVDSCTNAVDPYVQCDIRTVADGFFIPASVKFDRLGRLDAVDQNGDVVRINVVTGRRELIATLPPGLDNLAFDPTGDLFVSSASDGFVVRIDASGRVTPLLQRGIILPAGVAVVGSASQESIYVADAFTLRKYNARTGALLDQDSTFLAFSALQAPATVSADGSALLLTSWLGNAVQVWNPTTKTLLASYTDFAVPLNAIRFQGDIVVAELGSTPGTARVVRQTSSGRVTLAAMAVPSGLAAAGRDLWAADYANGTVLQLVANGVTLSPPIKVATGLKQPEGLAVDQRGRLLVVESGTKRLLRIDPSTRSISVVYTNLKVGLEAPTGAPPTFALSSVAVGPSGAIYISGDEGNLIYKGGP